MPGCLRALDPFLMSYDGPNYLYPKCIFGTISLGLLFKLALRDVCRHPLFLGSIHCPWPIESPWLLSYPGIVFLKLGLGMDLASTCCVIGGADRNSCSVSMITTPSTTLTHLDLPTDSQSRGRCSSRQIRSQNCWPSIHKWCVKKAPFIPISIRVPLLMSTIVPVAVITITVRPWWI